jgi:hypothetical protein
LNGCLRVFVSGPLTAPDLRQLLDNISAAERAAVDVIRAGHFPVVPHSMRGVHDEHRAITGVTLPDEWWMDWCLDLLTDCDALYNYAPGRESKGRDMEVKYAKRKGIPIVTTASELRIARARGEFLT